MNRLPSLFVSHGAPTFALKPGSLGPRLTQLGRSLPRPRAVLILSPHWTTPGVRVGSALVPPTVHDFGGFDSALYDLQYPAPGSPDVAEMATALLRDAGWSPSTDERQGYDHGAWVPMRYLYPDADVPLFQVSMPRSLDESSAYALGKTLAPLRDSGVLIVGSGSLTHNLYEFRGHPAADAAYAKTFAAWMKDTVAGGDHDRLLRTMSLAPDAARAHPTTEHLLPLMFAAGAGGRASAVTVIEGGITHGVLSMDSYLFNPDPASPS
jgi:4,5-DOPA dioxygenase extradiol